MFTFPWSLSNILPSCILLFWNIFSSDFADPSLPPERLNLRIEGEAKKHVGDTAGWYFRQNRFCHRYPYWRIDSKKYSMWFDINSGNWKIGLSTDLGTDRAVIIGPVCKDMWPQNIADKWMYGNSQVKDFIDAGKNVQSERGVVEK